VRATYIYVSNRPRRRWLKQFAAVGRLRYNIIIIKYNIYNIMYYIYIGIMYGTRRAIIIIIVIIYYNCYNRRCRIYSRRRYRIDRDVSIVVGQ